jgi:hypothetical protein
LLFLSKARYDLTWRDTRQKEMKSWTQVEAFKRIFEAFDVEGRVDAVLYKPLI